MDSRGSGSGFGYKYEYGENRDSDIMHDHLLSFTWFLLFIIPPCQEQGEEWKVSWWLRVSTLDTEYHEHMSTMEQGSLLSSCHISEFGLRNCLWLL